MEPAFLRKTYTEPFVLDRSKLSRILTVIEQEVSEASAEFEPKFEILFKNNKQVMLHSIQEVLSLDNSLRNPIRGLEVEARFPPRTDDSPIPTAVRLDFGSDRYGNINIFVTSPDTKRARELFAELEEQIDRIIVTNWIARYFKSATWWLFLLAFALALGASVVRITETKSQTQLSATDSAEVQRLLSSARTDSEKVDALVQAKLREINALRTLPVGHLNWSAILSIRGAFIALPVVVLIATLVYLIAACYPWVVFAWGDWEQHYNSLLSRRKMLGGVIVAALLIGIIANLFVASIPPLR